MNSKKKKKRKKAKSTLKVQARRRTGERDGTYDGSTPLKSLMQEMFVENLLRGMSGAEAYRQAGYKAKDANVGASISLTYPKVAARLAYRRAELQAQMQEETGITERRVLDEISRLAFSNMQDFLTTDADGNIMFRDLEKLSREQMAAVESVKITKITTKNRKGDREYTTQHTQFKLANKTANLEELGRHLGLFAKDNEQRQQAIVFQMLKFTLNGKNGGDDHRD